MGGLRLVAKARHPADRLVPAHRLGLRRGRGADSVGGWIVTEVGRQPWIVQGYMRTADAVTPANGIWYSLAAVLVLYAALGTTAILVLRRMAKRWREGGPEDDEGTPYAPPVTTVSGTR